MSMEEFEAEAELFYKDTGMLAPGKSEPADCGQYDFERNEVRSLMKKAWDAGRRRSDATLTAKLQAYEKEIVELKGTLAVERSFDTDILAQTKRANIALALECRIYREALDKQPSKWMRVYAFANEMLQGPLTRERIDKLAHMMLDVRQEANAIVDAALDSAGEGRT